MVSVQPGRQRAGLEACLHTRLQLLQVLRLRGTHVERARRMVRHDVGGRPAVRDDAVQAGVAADVLPQLRDGLVRGDHGVERVDSLLRGDRRVHCLAAVLDVHVRHAQHRRVGEVDGHRVRHHRHVDIVERARVHHDDLAAVQLLGRRAEDDDARIGRLDRLDQRHGGADAGRRDQVVPAGVADARQRIVLRADGDGDRAVAPLAAEGGLHAVDAGLHFESPGPEETAPAARPRVAPRAPIPGARGSRERCVSARRRRRPRRCGRAASLFRGWWRSSWVYLRAAESVHRGVAAV